MFHKCTCFYNVSEQKTCRKSKQRQKTSAYGRLPSCLSPGSLLSLCPRMVFLRQKRSKLSQVSSQGTNPIMRVHSHNLMTSQRPPLQIPLQWHLVLRVSIYEFSGRYKHAVQNIGSKGIYVLHFNSYCEITFLKYQHQQQNKGYILLYFIYQNDLNSMLTLTTITKTNTSDYLYHQGTTCLSFSGLTMVAVYIYF